MREVDECIDKLKILTGVQLFLYTDCLHAFVVVVVARVIMNQENSSFADMVLGGAVFSPQQRRVRSLNRIAIDFCPSLYLVKRVKVSKALQPVQFSLFASLFRCGSCVGSGKQMAEPVTDWSQDVFPAQRVSHGQLWFICATSCCQ